MPHVLVWITIFATNLGPANYTMVTDPFPTKEACEKWNDVKVSVETPFPLIDMKAACIPESESPFNKKDGKKTTAI